MQNDSIVLNEHNKQEYPPMHTAEHLLNGEMARRYGKGRAFSAHIERKKSKLDYHLDKALTDEEIKSLEDYINSIVKEDVEVTEEFITQAEAMERFDMSRLPEGASDTVRVVHVGKKNRAPRNPKGYTEVADRHRTSSYRIDREVILGR